MPQEIIAKLENGRVKRVTTSGSTITSFGAPPNALYVLKHGDDKLEVHCSDGKVKIYTNSGSCLRTI